MKIVTWNVNSLKAREGFVARFLDALEPDVLCIQELKLEEELVPRDLFTARGYHLAIHAQRQWNGVLIASKAPIEAVETPLLAVEEGQARAIAATIAGVRFVNLYCPQGQAADSPKFPYKLAFYDGLIAWLGARVDPAEPWVVMGDLNVAPLPADVWDPVRFAGVPTYHPEEHARWGKLEALGLEDVVRPLVPAGTHTFWDYRGGAFHKGQGMRIDHVLMTPPAAARVREAWVEREWRKKKDELAPSDHAPVVVVLE